MYFELGIHTCEGYGFIIPSGKSIYSRWAILKNKFILDHVHNVEVLGLRMIDYTIKDELKIANCENKWETPGCRIEKVLFKDTCR